MPLLTDSDWTHIQQILGSIGSFIVLLIVLFWALFWREE